MRSAASCRLPGTAGYVGLGFGSDPNAMYPSDIFLGWADGSGGSPFYNTYYAEVSTAAAALTDLAAVTSARLASHPALSKKINPVS